MCSAIRKSIGILALFGVIYLSTSGCDAPTTVPPEARAIEAASPSVSDHNPGIIVPADTSLADDRYLELGMPAHDRPWAGPEMAAASKVLNDLVSDDRSLLPRFNSEASGATFHRLIAEDNLDLFRNRSLPFAVRMESALLYTESLSQISKLYLAAFTRTAVDGRDMIELMGSNLRTSAVMVELTDELLPMLDPDASDYATRLAGLRRMKQGLATMLSGSIQTLTEPYRPEDLKRLIQILRATSPALLPALTDVSRKEVVQRLKRMQDDGRMQNLQPELSDWFADVQEMAEPR